MLKCVSFAKHIQGFEDLVVDPELCLQFGCHDSCCLRETVIPVDVKFADVHVVDRERFNHSVHWNHLRRCAMLIYTPANISELKDSSGGFGHLGSRRIQVLVRLGRHQLFVLSDNHCSVTSRSGLGLGEPYFSKSGPLLFLDFGILAKLDALS